jgi:phage tail-like protein
MELNGHDKTESAADFEAPAPWPVGEASGYLDFLPPVFQHNDFAGRFLSGFESVWEPLEQRQDHIAFYLDPGACPATWLVWLGEWLGVRLNPNWPEAVRRAVLAEIQRSYPLRGTRLFLARVLRAATGVTPRITTAQEFVFRIRWPRPVESAAIAEELIQMFKPAAAGYEIVN